MKPILYEANETQFNTNGLGRLADAISCKVTEERNGIYELAMEYPQTGIHCGDLAEGRLIYAVPFDGGQKQIFRIYYVSEPLNGIVTVNAEHISYLLNKMVVMPFTAGSAAEAIARIPQYAVGDCPFTFSTDKEVVANFSLSNPKEIRRILGGEAGSILDVYGKGEYDFDNFNVILRTNRGSNSGVTLRYGKNITELQRITDSTETYVGIVPFWADDTQTITLPERVVYAADHENDYAYKTIKTVDFSSEFQTAPTVEQLRARANRYLAANEGWTIKQTIKVSFVALWNTEEYKNVAPLERVHLCDTVNVFVKKLNINATAKVVKTVYDVLLERYDSIELGDASTSLAQTIQDQYIEPAVRQSTSHMDKAISHATKLIHGGLGGHVVMKSNADGEPEEILIMDTDDVTTAVNVLRINMNGIGFSSNGYNGPFATAWTLDGHFVADFIDSGTLTANLVKAGILSDEKGLNWWNMETGELHLNASTQIGDSTVETLSAELRVTAEGLSAEAKRATDMEEALNTKIDTTAEGLNVEIAKKVDDDTDVIITSINAKAGSVQIRTDNMDLTTNSWNLLSNGDFSLGNGALTYVNGDKYIQLKNGLSLMLNGIPLSGQRYYFYKDSSNRYNLIYNEATGEWENLTLHEYVNAGISEYNINVVQFPNYTILNGYFFVTSPIPAQESLFNYMFPALAYPRSLNHYFATTGAAVISISINSMTYRQPDDKLRLFLGNITSTEAIPASSAMYNIGTTYLSQSIPFKDGLEIGKYVIL